MTHVIEKLTTLVTQYRLNQGSIRNMLKVFKEDRHVLNFEHFFLNFVTLLYQNLI